MSYCFLWIPGKWWFFDNILMEIVSQKISTSTSSVSIIDTKEWALGPFFMLPIGGFENIKYYRNSIFIVVSNYSLVSVCCISKHHSISLDRTFCRFMVGNYDLMSWLKRHFGHHLKLLLNALRSRLLRTWLITITWNYST
jgi:hypothetical protein